MKRNNLLKTGIIAVMVLLVVTSWTVRGWGQLLPRNPWEVWDDKTKPVRGGYFRTANTVDVGLLNPNHFPVNDYNWMTYVYDRLLNTDGSLKPVPWLAESWVFPDQLTCIMKLRKGVRFSDGTPFNAEAVKFVEEWIMDPKNKCWSSAWLKPLKSIDVVEEYTVRWNFKETWGAFLGIMANIPGYMISPKALKEDPNKCDSYPVGTGPYILEDRSPGNWIKLKRNPNWWYGKSVGHPDMPYFDGILTTVIPDPSVQLANLKAGRIDSMTLAKSQYETVKNDPNLQVFVAPSSYLRGYRLNHSRPPFSDIRVRQAVAYAIDRKALIEGIEFGMGRIASCVYPEDHWAHNPSLPPWPYNPQKARQLLKEAGYSGGLNIFGHVYNNPQSQARGEAVKGMLAEVGINWKVDVLDAVAIEDRIKNLKYDMGTGDFPWIHDPDLMATAIFHPSGGRNWGRSNNEVAIALIEKGRGEIDMEKRQHIYFRLEKALYDNCEDIWLFWEMSPIALSKNIMGYNHDMEVRHKRVWTHSHPLWFKEGRP